MDLNFRFNKSNKYSSGRFVIDGLQVTGSSDGGTIDYNDIKLYVDGEPYSDNFERWSGSKASVYEVFDTVVSAYILNSNDFSFDSEWSVFSPITDSIEYSGDLIIKLPVVKYGDVYMYDLQLATDEFRYYAYEDMFMMLRKDGELVTDMENFYTQSLEADLNDILDGKMEAVYIDPYIQEAIDSGEIDEWLDR